MHRFVALLSVAAVIATAGTAFSFLQERVTQKSRPGAEALAASGCGSRSAGCSSSAQGRSCCSPSASGTADAQRRLDLIRSYLSAFYFKALGPGVTVDVKDFGCHQEADIVKEGRIIKRLSIRGREITEIT